MNRIACQYAIVRFAPFVETEEFANVGIIMIAPKQRFFGFELELKRYGRITNFFEEINANLYKKTLYNLKEELDRTTDIFKQHGFDKRLKKNDIDFANGLFKEIVRTRETIVRFGEVRTVLTDNPKEKLKELFAFYVGRNFVTKQYREAVLERGVRKWLYNENIAELYIKAKVGNDQFHANFPFVAHFNDRPIKIIKPLFLGQDEPTKIIEHGGAWIVKIMQLKKRNLLPNDVLFTIEGPKNNSDNMNACLDITKDLKDAGVEVVPFNEKEKIVEFALN